MASDWGMSPREVATWFQPVRQTVIASAAVGQQLVAADPDRVALVLATGSSSVALVSITPLTGMAAAGMPITLASGPVTLTLAEHGPLCQHDFYCESSTLQYAAWEVLVWGWPARRASPTARLEALIQALASQIRNLTQALGRFNPDDAQTSRVQRPGDRWRDTPSGR